MVSYPVGPAGPHFPTRSRRRCNVSNLTLSAPPDELEEPIPQVGSTAQTPSLFPAVSRKQYRRLLLPPPTTRPFSTAAKALLFRHLPLPAETIPTSATRIESTPGYVISRFVSLIFSPRSHTSCVGAVRWALSTLHAPQHHTRCFTTSSTGTPSGVVAEPSPPAGNTARTPPSFLVIANAIPPPTVTPANHAAVSHYRRSTAVPTSSVAPRNHADVCHTYRNHSRGTQSGLSHSYVPHFVCV